MLSSSQVSEAVNYNTSGAMSVGWALHYPTVATALGFYSHTPDPVQFSIAVGNWQAVRPPLTADGKLGPETWSKMQQTTVPASNTFVPPAWVPGTPEIDPPVVPIGPGPRWMQYAQAEKNLWDSRFAYVPAEEGKKAEFYTSRDEMYFHASPYFGGKTQARGTLPRNKSRLDWCAAFANWCLHAAGYSHTGSAGAGSFLSSERWAFDALKEPQRGCVIVVGSGSRGEHVGFLDEDKAGSYSIRLFGGNQSNRITVKNETRPMLSARGQNGRKSPFLWPLRGSGNCNHNPSTEMAHYCGRVF